MIGSQFRRKRDGAVITITGTYVPDFEPGDTPGYYYKVEGDPHRYWCSAQAMPVRFESLKS